MNEIAKVDDRDLALARQGSLELPARVGHSGNGKPQILINAHQLATANQHLQQTLQFGPRTMQIIGQGG
jgi:hypothetical protein